ncbi:aminotransferase class V-fold PLP-dependent enzyme [Microbacterium rhizosphaerae]|uniref:Aminotransferase class V-fold PLP-dependent enzyme n=1 Tax=Microbacterium rhizosphaerae TaxID=1678237 RepID=A0ABZ0SIA6_9MICO|nr:aminotransferase class V-fold PLP-dependent enzyme [Microbacterium rhizosphaerae]WPR88539.1 aminotransferase class V-fold PLP-dependent enzyme [Microbacterium rhizosphaerae]
MSDLATFAASFDGEPGYLDWAAFGPLSPGVRSEVQADADLLGTGRRSSIDLVADHDREARQLLGELLGTDAEHVTLQPSTSYGLMHAFFGLEGGLLVARSEFPSLTITAARAVALTGRATLDLFDPEDGFVTPDSIRDALTDQTTAVAVSLVDFRTGYRADLGAIRDVIGDRLLIVDAIQGFGVIEAEYEAADVVCGHGYKWLRAGRGTGFASFSDIARERIAPVLSGFAAVEGDLPVDAIVPPAASVQAYGVSVLDHLAAGRLAATAREIADVGVGVIERALAERVDEVIALADGHGIPVVTPRDPARRAGIVALAPDPQDAGPLAATLANYGLVFTTRSGLIRLAPHAGTDIGTLHMLQDALGAFAASRVA